MGGQHSWEERRPADSQPRGSDVGNREREPSFSSPPLSGQGGAQRWAPTKLPSKNTHSNDRTTTYHTDLIETTMPCSVYCTSLYEFTMQASNAVLRQGLEAEKLDV